MKYVVLLLVFFASNSYAETFSKTSYAYHDASISGLFGVNNGGFSLGGDYEMHIERTWGLGGYGRYFSKSSKRSAPGVMALGAFVRPHFHKMYWDFHVTVGLGLQFIDGNNEDATTLGPLMGFGLFYQLNRQISLGSEVNHHFAWTDEDFQGNFLTDFMLKARFGF